MKIFRSLSRLYWKIAILFMAVILILAGIFLWISIETSLGYFQEASQKLNADVARQIASDTEPYIGETINVQGLEHLFHSVMVLHPSLEIYLLNTEGDILTYSAPDSLIKLREVNLDPVENFIQNDGNIYVKGPDPRHPGQHKIFSAAPIIRSGTHLGYVYAILRGDQYISASEGLFESYGFRLALKVTLIALLTALVIGLLAFRLITRNLDHVIRQIRAFQLKPENPSGFRMQASGELKQLADTFNHMADEIEENIREIREMERSHRDLVANVSHDLRTPLSTIRGYAETLLVMKNAIGEEDKEKYTRIILNNAVRLKKQADELFELSRLESKEIRPIPEPFSIAELVLDNIQKYSVKAKQKGINLSSEIPEDTPLTWADIGLIDRVLQNLIDNALKFTPSPGSVTVELCHRVRPGNVCVMVRDTGLGIPEDEQPVIFNRYMKGKRENTEDTGTGLGLAIVKSILDLHDIAIHVESQEGEGTMFYFDLPVYKSDRK